MEFLEYINGRSFSRTNICDWQVQNYKILQNLFSWWTDLENFNFQR